MKRKKLKIEKRHQLDMDTQFLKSCDDAVKALHELNIYINTYKRDSDYKASVRKICDQIRNMQSTEGLESNYGQLMFEGRMKFKKETEQKYENNCYLMCFQHRILVFDIEEPEDKKRGILEIFKQDSSYQHSKEFYVYISSIKVTQSMMCVSEESAGNKDEGVITIRNMKNFVVDTQESFSVMVPRGENNKELEELKKQFGKLIEDAMTRPTCDKHRMHDYHTAIQKHDIEIKNPKPPPRCAECNLYIFGLLFMGYRCETCKEVYHKECFMSGMEMSHIYGMLFKN